jgi:hypothetical protein
MRKKVPKFGWLGTINVITQKMEKKSKMGGGGSYRLLEIKNLFSLLVDGDFLFLQSLLFDVHQHEFSDYDQQGDREKRKL